MDDRKPTDKPFEEGERLSDSSLELLRDWLEENGDPATVICRAYTVGNLIDDLDNMLDGMWSDGIDAMGEDA